MSTAHTAEPQHSEPAKRWISAIGNLDRVHRAVLADVEEAGLPSAWFMVLERLSEAPEHRLPMGEIARGLSMTTGGFTKLADRMAKAGLIDRRGASADRRKIYAALTEQGHAQAEQARAAFAQALHSHVLSVLSPDDIHTLEQLSTRLASAGAPSTTSADEPDDPAEFTLDPASSQATERRRTDR